MVKIHSSPKPDLERLNDLPARPLGALSQEHDFDIS